MGWGRCPTHPRMRPFLLEVLLARADGVSCWATSSQMAQVSRDNQCQRYFIIYLYKFYYTNSISYDLYNFAGRLRAGWVPASCSWALLWFGWGPSGQEMEFTEDPSRHETKFTEDPLEVSWRRRTRKSHYVAPPPVPTNQESRPIIKPFSERWSFSIFSIYNGYSC
jgi:hypothetical protein